MEIALRPPLDPDFRVIETFGFHPSHGIRNLELHLQRCAKTCARLSISFDISQAQKLLKTLPKEAPLRVRLTVDAKGKVATTHAVLVPSISTWRVAVSATMIDAEDPWLSVKTTERTLYDAERSILPNDIDEVVFTNAQGNLTEGTITNIFVSDGDKLLTPPVSAGLLPGVLRAMLLETERAVEAELAPDDLRSAPKAFVGNSLRGLIPATLV